MYQTKVIWFTGLSGSGKSTLAGKLRECLLRDEIKSIILDGDVVRKGLSKDLGFSDEDRRENVRRVAEVSKLFFESGMVVITALISPFEADRGLAREIIGKDNIIEVFVECPLEVCEQRDVKGLYKKARRGEIANFTGVSSPYEVPGKYDIAIRTDGFGVEESVKRLYGFLIPILKK